MKTFYSTFFAMLMIVSFANAQSSKKQKKSNKMDSQTIEITYFKPKANVSQEIFGARNIRVGVEYAAKQPGFISRETGVDADGLWVIIVHWETMENSQASMKKCGNESSVADFKEMIEPSSFKMSVFTSKALIKK